LLILSTFVAPSEHFRGLPTARTGDLTPDNSARVVLGLLWQQRRFDMLGGLLRAVLVIVLVVAALAFFAGYRFSNGEVQGPTPEATVGTVGDDNDGDSTRARARETGAKVGEAVGAAGDRAAEALSDGALTAKIKSKMALDDTVGALDIDVDTVDGNVTLSGRVRSEQERQRAVALARETEGVKNVADRLVIGQ
jgi:hyperosmotically inducible protein